jgi:hypothetical protein
MADESRGQNQSHEIGRAVGYESAPSFSQAFTRLIASLPAAIAEVCGRTA